MLCNTAAGIRDSSVPKTMWQTSQEESREEEKKSILNILSLTRCQFKLCYSSVILQSSGKSDTGEKDARVRVKNTRQKRNSTKVNKYCATRDPVTDFKTADKLNTVLREAKVECDAV